MVRLEVSCCFFVRLNSFAISIPVWCDWKIAGITVLVKTPNFNSSMVRLEEFYGIFRHIRPCHFNSSMVRLEDSNPPNRVLSGSLFQFQYGAIGSNLVSVYFKGAKYFNSSMVRLEVLFTLLGFQSTINFNSSMVRLEDCWRWVNTIVNYNFNSSMVRLEG